METIKRIFGMLPASEVKISKKYQAASFPATVESGDFGWSVIWADGSVNYKDAEDSPENNFERALEFLKEYFPDAKEIVDCGPTSDILEIHESNRNKY